MKTETSEHIQLVCRTASGREIARQTFAPDETARAERIMYARNRAEMNAWRLNPDDAPRWGIETVTLLSSQP